jgi:hypothetical protein
MRGSRLLWLALAAGGALALWGRADEAADGPPFVARTAAGSAVRGPLRQLGADWSVRLGEGEGTRAAGGELLTVRRAGLALPPLPTGEHLVLVNGDRIPVNGDRIRSPRLAGERLHFLHPDLAGGKETSVPLAAVAVFWRMGPDKDADPEKLRRSLVRRSRNRDTVLLRNGDVLEGVLNGLDGTEVAVEVDKKPVAVKINQVAAVALSSDLADALRPKGAYARLVLTEAGGSPGGRLSLSSATCTDGATLKGVTVFGASVRVPLARVAALDLYQGAAVYLSDLKPSKYEYLPYLDDYRPWVADGNAAGGDLRLGGSTYDKGLGMHSHSRLTWDLAGGYRRFEALVGLDDRDGRKGSVRVKVLADGKALDLGADKELTAQSGPLPVSVKVEGIKELTLEVEFGANGNVQDVVNWADARLVQ